uniref:Reelin domain-containing protein n=1 Tax=Sphaeramia orbicularis TaxID=375764 RepID=A0A673ABS5_9TELE
MNLGVFFLFLAPPTLSFSHGARHASCWDMIPGHIRAHPQDPQRSHVTLHTSTSSYLPGHFVTVTVRSSRDFMGFLLQARMGGSWRLAPPGTHTLHCLSEGDTITHSDKQLKRNLSFVWRAPDVPMGDIRFYITVVQSYFVYWAGIKSALLQDLSPVHWKGRNSTELDGGSSFSAQEDMTTRTGVCYEIHAHIIITTHPMDNKKHCRRQYLILCSFYHPNFKVDHGDQLKPNLPNTDAKPKGPPITPDKEGKYPDIIPRHSTWELGMLLGCSAGLGMVLVVGVRYMYRQACGKRTEVTLNDREREYSRGERGLIHVQECGDLVRVRRLRDNSFVFLAEYDILASPGD